MLSLLQRPTVEAQPPGDAGQPPPYPVASRVDVDEETLVADAIMYTRLGLREQGLTALIHLLLRGLAAPRTRQVLASALRVEAAEVPGPHLLIDACTFSSIGLREKALTCLARALLDGLHTPVTLSLVLRELRLPLPPTEALPLLEGVPA